MRRLSTLLLPFADTDDLKVIRLPSLTDKCTLQTYDEEKAELYQGRPSSDEMNVTDQIRRPDALHTPLLSSIAIRTTFLLL